MNPLEDRVRAAVRATAEQIGPHDVPPLRSPGSARRQRSGRPGGRRAAWRWGAPLAAAAAVVAVALTVTSLGTGISGQHSSGPGGPVPPGQPTASAGTLENGEIRLPLDGYELTVPQLNDILTAQNVASHLCLQQLGFDLSLHVFGPVDTDVPRYQLHYLPLAIAQKHGYSDATAGTGDTGRTPGNGGYKGGSTVASPTAYDAWAGTVREVNGHAVPKGGCSLRGHQLIYTPAIPPSADPLQFIYQSEGKVLADRRMLAAFTHWRACMAARAYNYPNPLAAQEASPTGQEWPSGPSAAEIATATADAQCRQQTDVEGIWLALMGGYETQVIKADLPQLVSDKKVTDQWVRKAERLLHGVPAGG